MDVTSFDGARLRSRRDGRVHGATILYINSLGCDMAMWEPQCAALEGRHRHLRYDARGHGQSDAPEGDYDLATLGRDALAVLDAHDVERAHVCGLSLGGLTAQWLAIHAPERVERLVLANTASRVGSVEGWTTRAETVRSRGMEAVADVVIGRFFSPGFSILAPATVARFRAVLIATAPAGYAGCCAALRDADLTADLPRISAPTLVIGGASDVSTPPEQGAALAAAIPGASFLTLDAAHISNIETHATFTAAMRRHFEADGP